MKLLMRFVIALVTLVALGTPVAAQTDAYPTKPIRFVVPYPPGGGNDDVARLIGKKISESMGQPVIIDNRVGASGLIGGDFVSKAAPDGYTIMIDHAGIAINPALYPSVPYNVLSDLAPVTLAVSQGSLMLVNPSVPARDVKELIA